jgi:hypothetical protein
MISGVHVIVFSPEAEALRAFLKDVVGLGSIDAGDGWPIFALPPAELAVHPAELNRHELYLQTDDLDAAIAALVAKGVRLARSVTTQPWGRATAIALPDGSELALYEPSHPRAAAR